MATRGVTGGPLLKEPLVRILEARHHDPFEVLGSHPKGARTLIRVFLPKAEQVREIGRAHV
jgi:1,4-alpha-glucan branching enzyme